MRSSHFGNSSVREEGSIDTAVTSTTFTKTLTPDIYSVTVSNENDILRLPTRPITQDERSTSPITVPPAYQNSLFNTYIPPIRVDTVEQDKIPPAIKSVSFRGPDPPKKPKFILKSPLPKDEVDEVHIPFNEFYNFSPEIRQQEVEYQERRKKEKSAFDQWLVNKILHNDTLKLLETLCKKEGNEYFQPYNITCEELAECLVCIDFRYGLWKTCDCPVYCTDEKHNVFRFVDVCKCSAKKCIMCRGCINCKGTFRSQCDCEIKSLGDSFVIMARQFLPCVDVEVSKNIYYQFNANGREMQFYELNDPKANGKYILRNLKYSLRPPSNNERIMNSIITMKTKKLYLKKTQEVSKILEEMDPHARIPYLNKHGQTQLLDWIYDAEVNEHMVDQQAIDEKFADNYKMWEGFVYSNPKKVKLSVEQYMYDIKQKELSEIQPMIDDNYRQWKNNKYYIEQARFYLSRINLPPSKRIYKLKAYQFSEDEDEMMHLWKIVGENLKTIDASLEGDFHDWSSIRYSNHLSHAVWDMLPPVACDIHHISTPTRLLLQHFFYYTNNCLLHLAELFLPIVREKETRGEDEEPVSLLYVLKKLRKCMRECSEMEDKDDNEEEDDDGNEFTSKDTLYKLKYEEFDLWLKKINCNFIKSDKEMIYSLFNKGKEKRIYAYKILQYIGLYPHKNRIDKICKWKFVCHLCGMNRAFDYDGKTEMKDHKLRRVNPFVDECHQIQMERPKQCEACKSTQEDKVKSLEILHQIALKQLKTEVIEAKFASCNKPNPPKFSYKPGDFAGENRTNSFTLKWKPSNENDIILFYVLEIQSLNSKRFEEVIKDPPNINELSEGIYFHEKADCFHQYRYRLSAINTAGRSNYVYLDPQPEPLPPPVTPFLMSNTSFSIQLCWDKRNEYRNILTQMNNLFIKCDTTNSNEVCLADFIKEINGNSDVMDYFLHIYPKKISPRLNKDRIIHNKKVSLYDLLTALDSYSITYQQLTDYLYSSPYIRHDNYLPRNGKFLLERCVSAERDEWAVEYEGEDSIATIYHLKPSTYYKFRVRIKGTDSQISNPGKVFTGYSLLPQPDPPELLNEASVTSNIIKLKLKEYRNLNKQDNDTKLKEGMRLNELIAGWAGYNLSRDIDYEIKNVVQPYVNENGNINPSDFESVIHSIGLDMDEEQMNEGIDELVKDNEINIDKMNSWLMSSKVKYNIQAIPVNKRDDKKRYTTKYSSTVTLSELEPDTKYQISLQLATNVNRSYYSKPIYINTLPLAPSSISVVDLNSNEVYLKWYYEGPNNSSYKVYTLEIRGPILDNKICNWRTCYQGQTSMYCVSELKPNNSYEFRVNCNGSNWSESKLIQTLYEYESYVSNLNVFTIDDYKDVSVGDLILFKERGKKMVGRVVKESEIRHSNGITTIRNLSISIVMSRIHQYKPGMVIQRIEDDLYDKSGNEVLRKRWDDEDDRRHINVNEMSSTSSSSTAPLTVMENTNNYRDINNNNEIHPNSSRRSDPIVVVENRIPSTSNRIAPTSSRRSNPIIVIENRY